MSILFVQRFGLGGAGGGPRILRHLVADPPIAVRSVCTSPTAPGAAPVLEQRHPARPAFGRLESTRVSPWLDLAEPAFQRRVVRGLERAAQETGAEAIHAVAHGLDFWPALNVARGMGLAYLLTVHDDLGYVLRKSPLRGVALKRLAQAWREADARFVITPELGEEFSRRYGRRDFVVVTDGVARREAREIPPTRRSLDVYFLGSYHLAYRENFEALVAGLEQLRLDESERGISLTFRGGGIPFHPETALPVAVLPFAPEPLIEQEIRSAGVLYMPLPFGVQHRDFVRLSLPTKLITYLGGGRPILYHGPADAAVARLLKEHEAGIVVNELDGEAVADGLRRAVAAQDSMVTRALELAATEFDASRIRVCFWDTVLKVIRRRAAG
jgi:hypothetical protein